MDDKTIKERLDNIITDIDGIIFTKTTKNGWDVYTSSAGLKYAILETDHINITWNSDSSVFGTFVCNKIFDETIPAGIFTIPPNVTINVTIPNSTYIGYAHSVLPPSTTYIGENRILAIDIDNSQTQQPTKIHTVYTVIGF